MGEKQRCGGLDAFRLLAAVLVIAIHTSPLSSFNSDADFFLTRILSRIAVPFFFMVTGQFVVAGLFSNRAAATPRFLRHLKKLCLLYGAATLLYLPVGIYAGHYRDLSLSGVVQLLLFDGPFYHLWYFPACILGILLIFALSRFMTLKALTALAGGLYLFGLFGDSYYGLIQGIPLLHGAYSAVFQVCSYTRNGLFFTPLFLLLGVWTGGQCKRLARTHTVIGFAVSFAAMTAEGFLLHAHGLQRHDSMYLMLIPTMLFLYQLLSALHVPAPRSAGPVAAWIYILHPAMIIAVRVLGKLSGQTALLVENSLIHYLAVTLLSIAGSYLPVKLISAAKGEDFKQGRAWIELDRSALEHNVSFLRSRLPKGCALMAAVKADAYGHGAVPLSRELNRLHVHAFCVAGVSEGVTLRKHGIKGEILILGYTHPAQFDLLRRYRLTQTVVDYDHAQTLNQYGKKLHVHIGVDTGMHRIGERSENTPQICAMFEMPNLIIDGLFTHLSASDMMTPQAQDFTMAQIDAFYGLIQALKEKGYAIPKLHLQASYGVLNYPELASDYARVGIGLYGVLSTKEDTLHLGQSLRPVLSLKARVASVRTLHVNESAGYGITFTAKHEMKIAAITIGYADGLPRSLSNGGGAVLIHGHKAPIIGRVCMDQTIVDVSEIPNITGGDIATIIGVSGDRTITAGDLAEQTGSITNEILCRLGSRLERIVV